MKHSLITKLIVASMLVLVGSGSGMAAGYSAPGSSDFIARTVDAPFVDFTVLTADDTTGHNVVAGRAIEANCTVAGSISFKLANGKSKVLPVVTGEQSFMWGAIGLNATGTTATCTVSVWY